MIMQHPGDQRLTGSHPATHLVGGFQDGHIHARLGEGDRGRQPVGAATHHYCC
jgi:hypothetical protein